MKCTRPSSRHTFKSFIENLFVAGVLAFSSAGATAAPEDDVRLVFDQFVKAQNAHDVSAVRELLLDSPNFLWVTRGAPIWGRDAALKRFETLYQGTWKLSPDMANLKAVLVSDTSASFMSRLLSTSERSARRRLTHRFS